MKHRKKQRILGREAHHRSALLTNLGKSLLEHGSIVTTRPKAQELRKFIEPLITKARGEITLHRRRQLLSKIGGTKEVAQLIAVAQQQQRTSGYVRITRLPILRQDDATMVRVDLIDFKREA